ncbi:MAG TPA: cytochrome c, partial [Vicinamibacteria bacterium]
DYAGSVYRVAWGAGGSTGAARPAAAAVAGAGPAAGSSLDPRAIARGKALFDRLACAACHDPEAAAPGMVTRPLAGLARRYDAGSLAGYLRAPQPPMPAVDLADADRRDLARFLLAAHP